jgi:precorrin-2 methylase
VEHATMHNQQIIPIENLEAQKVPYFSMILVHKNSGSSSNVVK